VTANQTERRAKMLLASAYDQSKYFKAADIPQEKKLRIKDVTEEEIGVGQDKEKKLCVWFTNDPRGLVLNKTNNRILRTEFGDDCAGWKGKIIVMYPTTDEFRGRMVPALRVRIPPPKEGNGQTVAAKPKPPASPPDAELLDDELNDDVNF
jgi:hypothetical protein